MTTPESRNCATCKTSWTAPVNACPKCGIRGWMLEASNALQDERFTLTDRVQIGLAHIRVNRDTRSETAKQDLALLKMALGNTAACLGDVLAIFNKVAGETVFKNAAPQEPSGENAAAPISSGVTPAAAAPEVTTGAERPQSK